MSTARESTRESGAAKSNAASTAAPLAMDQGLLCFTLSGRIYGLDVSVVREVIPVKQVIPVPRVPRPIAGIFVLRGATVALVNTEILFGMDSGVLPQNALIIVRGHRVICGLAVESVQGVIPFDGQAFTAAVVGQDPAQVAGYMSLPTALLTVLDATTIINSLERLRS